MQSYRHPGVYIEELPSGRIPIEAASTSTAAFIGFARRGPIDTPVLVTRLDDFKQRFGQINDTANGIRDLGDAPDHFGHAVNAFFLNGGRKAYIVRVVADPLVPAAATGELANPGDLGNSYFRVAATSPGAWGDALAVSLTQADPADLDPENGVGYQIEIGQLVDGQLEAIESFSGLSLDPNSGSFLPDIVNQGSDLVEVTHVATPRAIGAASVLKSRRLRAPDVADLATKKLTLTINTADSQPGEITFAAGDDTLAKVAAKIQQKVRSGGSKNVRKLFRAAVTQAGEILLVPGDLENAAATVAVDSGDAAAVFGFQSISFPDRPTVPLVGGQDGSTPSSAGHFSTALTALRDYRDASILVLPGCTYEDHSAVYDAAITHAESMTNRMVIVDPKSSVEHRTGKSVKDAAYPASTHAALYYPWLKVANPFHNPETAANKPRTFEIAPSGFVAGLWSRIDGSRGVWKAPAGLEATVRGAQGTTVEVGNDIQDQLNGRGVNCIRSIIGPLVIWGARTLATRTQPDFRYVPVRRTSILIGESLYNALQSAVFEPNKHVLWASLRANVGAFMESLFRAGAFQGAKASDAYFVRCGLDDTMTQRDIDAGVVRVIVGYAPLKPAEFVVIQIQQKLQQQT